jgi:ribonucleoside-triphosphate reductase
LVSFIYTINQPLRGNQSCFTNISIYDDVFLNKLLPDYKIGDYGISPQKDTVKKIQEIFLQVMNKELSRTPITFPVTTACFSIDENKEIQDKEFLRFIAKYNQKYGFINIYIGKTSTLSSCCRLRSETDNEYFNSFGAGSTKIGSLGVCTINLPRMAFKNKNKNNIDNFNIELKNLVQVCSRVNNAKRKLVQKRITNGNHPLYSLGFISLNKQYSTVGINGFNECIQIMDKNIVEQDGIDFGLSILHIINAENDKIAKQYGVPHNTEQIPAENVSIKLAQKDELLGYNNQYDLYSNQFIPLTANADIFDRIKLQGIFDEHFSGGSIAHLNLETTVSEETIINLIETCAKKGVVYFALNYVLSECESGHMVVTKNNTCTICGCNIINQYTRVVGFLTNVKNWHKVRREKDFPNRQFYNEVSI